MKILLTGASGFVGTHFRELISCVSLAHENENLDIRNEAEVRSAVATAMPDAIVHLAAQSSVARSFFDPKETFDTNFYGTLNLLNALKAVGFSGRLLVVSSGDVYGRVPPENLPISEDEPLKPSNPYAVSKMAAEGLCYQWSQSERFEIIIARSFNHIGRGQSPNFAISDFARQIVAIRYKKQSPTVYVGDIDVSRDFLDVRDVVKAYQELLRSGRNGEVYNVCSGVERTVRSLLEGLLRIANIEAILCQEPARFRPSDQKRVVGSPQKLKAQTSWEPSIEIDRSLEDVLNGWENEAK